MLLTTEKARKIAQHMCEASALLEGYYRGGISGYIKIDYRVGSGKSTHCKRVSSCPDQFELTYGLKMVQDKATSPAKCSGWLTGREILNKRYMEGEFTLLNCLAHTVFHESAHIIQNLEKGRFYRSVHNQAFYDCLTRLYQICPPQKIVNFLRERSPIEWEDSYVAPDFSVHDRVTFQSRDGDIRTGTILKINKRTVRIKVDGSRNPWRVGPAYLRMAE